MGMVDCDRRTKTARIAHSADWLERMYAEAWLHRVPWDDGRSHPMLMDWLNRHGHVHKLAALDVGCGLGYNAEALASRGYHVTAVDVAPTAIKMCRYYNSVSCVRYVVADALKPQPRWRRRFDLVFEAGFLQVLPDAGPTLELALRGLCGFVRLGGRLLTICRLRKPGIRQSPHTPWHFVRDEVERLASLAGLQTEECVVKRQGGVTRAALTFVRVQDDE